MYQPGHYPTTSESHAGDPLHDRVHRLISGGAWRESAAAQAERNGYVDAHQAYLGEVSHSLDARVAERGSGLVTESFNPGEKTAFAMKDDKAVKPLDPQSLGLPAFETPGYTPLAVVVHEGTRTGKPAIGAIEMLVREDRTGEIRGRYLENFGALDASRGHKPQWVGGGSAELSASEVATDSQIVGNPKTAHAMQTVQATEIDYRGDGKQGHAHLIRPKPTAVEAAAGAGRKEGFIKRHAKKLGTLAALSATLAAAPFVHSAKSPDSDVDLKNPDQMVQQAGYNPQRPKDGVRQAEEFFTKGPLDRSREAFAAYARGDKAALAAEAAKYEYQDNWIDPSTFENVKKATSPQEIEVAFKKALEGLPITISFDAGAAQYDGYTYQPSTNLEDQKQIAMGVMRVYNLLDKSSMQEHMHPIQYVLVASMKSTRKGGVAEPAGLFLDDTSYRRAPQVVLATNYSSIAESLAAHETGHDFSDTGVFAGNPKYMNGVMNSLNPAGHNYVGYDNYSESPTSINGNKIAEDPYSNAEDAEDLANTVETVLVDKPVITAEESTFLEKQQAVIFEMERLNPGFTAAFLLRADVKYPTAVDKAQDKTIEAIWSALDVAQVPNEAAAGLILFALAASMVRRRQETTDSRKYGVIPASAGGLVMKYSPYTRKYEPVKEDTNNNPPHRA
ncbi:MAG TPA: hypothetical protein VLI54_02250 [Bacillota bacterium]|nr:hypothetical protein [Bacillota bacterium]